MQMLFHIDFKRHYNPIVFVLRFFCDTIVYGKQKTCPARRQLNALFPLMPPFIANKCNCPQSFKKDLFQLINRTRVLLLTGKVNAYGLMLFLSPEHYTFTNLRDSPSELISEHLTRLLCSE